MAYDQAAADWQRDAEQAQERIAAALALLRTVPSQGSYGCGDTCHHDHADCLAARTIAILTGEGHHHAH